MRSIEAAHTQDSHSTLLFYTIGFLQELYKIYIHLSLTLHCSAKNIVTRKIHSKNYQKLFLPIFNMMNN